ncbi:hypothetical protein QN400_24260 [Pseudomonas sp. RTC3]|uniref:hypothetical protein n=1 Tax=Pseudomonas sp. 5C2 TaxID=3048588 RepID=UPI002AB4E916|nr:hypothetical protein [Pseudomonas sp. 5C2]MDY7567707.1 hypothetical protein [Pseudomonas sp. 5C2]MEB0065120.1 hypothetical protein [Pseudomonas sp. RTC3]MEB0241021.1 hypothetical protein [Pseudomonas sp. 5C2]
MSALTAAQEKTTDAFASATKDSSLMALNSLAPTQNTDYPKPHVQEAPSDTLDPLLGNPSGVHVEVAYPSMRSSDIIGLFFNGNDTFAVQNGSVFGTVTFLAPVADVTLAVGKTIQVIYAVVRPDGVILSEILNLIVQPIAADKLPTPQITQASEGVLDLTTFDGDADVTVEAWPLIAVGQTVWLTVTGPGGVPIWKLLEGYAITAADVTNGIGRVIARGELDRLEEGGELRVVFKVGFEWGSDESIAVGFPISIFNISLNWRIEIENFETAIHNETIPAGGVRQFPALTILARTEVKIVNAGYSPWATNYMVWMLGGTVEFRLATPAERVVFGIYSDSVGTITINYLDVQGLSLSVYQFGGVLGKWVEYTCDSGKKIYTISVIYSRGDRGAIVMDNFSIAHRPAA